MARNMNEMSVADQLKLQGMEDRYVSSFLADMFGVEATPARETIQLGEFTIILDDEVEPFPSLPAPADDTDDIIIF